MEGCSPSSGQCRRLRLVVPFVLVAVLAEVSLLVEASAQSSELLQLDQDNFDKEVLQRKEPILVEFYSPSCGHCVTFGPELVKIAHELETLLPTGQVDITKNSALQSKYKVMGVPTLLLFLKDKQSPLRYSGVRGQRHIVQFVLANTNHSYVVLSPPATTLPNFLVKKENAGALPRVIYFAGPDENENVPVHIATLAKTWKDSLLFGFVPGDSEDKSWQAKYGLDSLPALILFSPINLIEEAEARQDWNVQVREDPLNDLFLYRYTGSLASEAELNAFCNEASARSALSYEKLQRFNIFTLNRTTFNVLFLVSIVGIGAVFYWLSTRHGRGQFLLPVVSSRMRHIDVSSSHSIVPTGRKGE